MKIETVWVDLWGICGTFHQQKTLFARGKINGNKLKKIEEAFNLWKEIQFHVNYFMREIYEEFS